MKEQKKHNTHTHTGEIRSLELHGLMDVACTIIKNRFPTIVEMDLIVLSKFKFAQNVVKWNIIKHKKQISLLNCSIDLKT